MKRIYFISQVFYPDTSATSQLMQDLLRNIAEADIGVTVICGYPTMSVGKVGVSAEEKWHHIDIYRGGLKIESKRGLLYRALSYLSFLAFCWNRLRSVVTSDDTILIGVTNPPFMPIFLWVLSLVNGMRYSVLAHDIYPDGLIALGKLNMNSLVAKIWRELNRFGFKKADQIIVLGRDMQALICEAYSIPLAKLPIVTNWSVFNRKQTIVDQSSNLLAKLELQGKFVVQYSGNMGLWHDLDTIVNAAIQLKDVSGIHFLMIGNGIRRDAAKRSADEHGLKNVTWLDFVPITELEDSLASCDVALISLREGLEGIAVPSKLYGILASGRAIVALVPVASEVALVTLEEKCGVVVAPHDPTSLVQELKFLADNRDLVRQMGRNAYQAYREKYTVEVVAERFRKILWPQEQV